MVVFELNDVLRVEVLLIPNKGDASVVVLQFPLRLQGPSGLHRTSATTDCSTKRWRRC
jgi:hypothetical protein